MMGYRRFAPKLYYQLSRDRLVPHNHLLRRIAEIIDFSFVYPLARPYYSHTGQPSVDPVVLFKALLIGYLYGITSERRLMEEIQVKGNIEALARSQHEIVALAFERHGPAVEEVPRWNLLAAKIIHHQNPTLCLQMYGCLVEVRKRVVPQLERLSGKFSSYEYAGPANPHPPPVVDSQIIHR